MTLDGEAEELEPMLCVEILNFLRVELHLHLHQLRLQYLHGYRVVLANEEHVVRIAYIVAVQTGELLVYVV